MIFVDAGPFIARYAEKDQYHLQAVEHWNELAAARQRLFTSNLVLSEALTLLARRTGYRFAAETAGIIYASRSFTILRPEHEDESTAIRDFERYADQKVSFTDCVSFALMRRLRIRRAFTFDRHFTMAGFEAVP